MSGTLNIHGSLETSSQAVVYSVSALGAVTAWIIDWRDMFAT